MKIHKFPKALRMAFTLVELLVVISIIAVLASIAMPAMTGVIERGQQTKVVSDARQIYIALKMSAGDNDGRFIDGDTDAGVSTANDAFKKLLTGARYLNTEKPFFVSKSKWCGGNDKPLETISGTTPADSIMKAGVNHFAYAAGLYDSNSPGYPLLADGPTEGSNGASGFLYTSNDGLPGGVWKGKSAIVVYVDGSAKAEKTVASGNNFMVKRPSSNANDNYNLLQVDTAREWLAGATLLLPQKAGGSGGE